MSIETEGPKEDLISFRASDLALQIRTSATRDDGFRIVRSLLRRQQELKVALVLAGDALARYEVSHDQDKGSWSLEGLHIAEEIACLAQLKIEQLLQMEDE